MCQEKNSFWRKKFSAAGMGDPGHPGDVKAFIERTKEVLAQVNLREVHRATGIPYSNLHRYKEGALPDAPTAFALAEYFGLDLRWYGYGENKGTRAIPVLKEPPPGKDPRDEPSEAAVAESAGKYDAKGDERLERIVQKAVAAALTDIMKGRWRLVPDGEHEKEGKS